MLKRYYLEPLTQDAKVVRPMKVRSCVHGLPVFTRAGLPETTSAFDDAVELACDHGRGR